MVGVENYKDDITCYRAVQSGVYVEDFIQALIEDRKTLVKELSAALTQQKIVYIVKDSNIDLTGFVEHLPYSSGTSFAMREEA